MSCVFLIVWDFLEYINFDKESIAKRTKSNPVVGSLGDNGSARKVL